MKRQVKKEVTGENGKIEVVTEIEAVKTYKAGWYRLIEFANSENLQLGENGFFKKEDMLQALQNPTVEITEEEIFSGLFFRSVLASGLVKPLPIYKSAKTDRDFLAFYMTVFLVNIIESTAKTNHRERREHRVLMISPCILCDLSGKTTFLTFTQDVVLGATSPPLCLCPTVVPQPGREATSLAAPWSPLITAHDFFHFPVRIYPETNHWYFPIMVSKKRHSIHEML